jgi:hypothetical protein
MVALSAIAKQRVDFSAVGDAEGLMLPEIGVALVSGEAAAARDLFTMAIADDATSPIHSIDPECFMFATGVDQSEHLSANAGRVFRPANRR